MSRMSRLSRLGGTACMSARRRLAGHLLGSAAVVAIAACGGGGTGSGSGSTTAPLATAPGVLPATSPSGGTASPAATTSPGATSGAPITVVPAGGQITVLSPLGLNFRAQASTTAAVIGRLGRGAALTVVSHQAGWYQAHGATVTGWVTDDPSLVSPRTFNMYDSQSHGVSLLYPDTWTFSDQAAYVVVRPQTGTEAVTVVTGPTNAAIGSPGRSGYVVSALDSIVVYGVTGTIRTYDRSSSAGTTPAPTAPAAGATPASGVPITSALAHFMEVRLSVGTTFFMEIVFDYDTTAQLPAFRDILNSVYLPAASVTPAPVASPTP